MLDKTSNQRRAAAMLTYINKRTSQVKGGKRRRGDKKEEVRKCGWK